MTTSLSAQINVNCNGDSTGSASVSASGGTTPYSYLWNSIPNQTNPTASNLIAGSYTVTVSDSNACTSMDTVIISQPSPLLDSLTSIGVSCNGDSTGSATATVSGGIFPYSYIWNNNQTTSTAINLAAGNYSVVVTDSNGCITTQAISITEPTLLTASTTTSPILCFGDTVGALAIASGGTPVYTYSWSNGQTTQHATGLSSGSYTLTITDSNSCAKTSIVTLTQPPTLSVSVTETNPICKGGTDGTATAMGTGGTPAYNYVWDNGQFSATATGLAAGLYIVTVSDSNNCTKTDTITITQPSGPIATLVASSTTVLLYEHTQLSATGGATYSWLPSTALSCDTCKNLIATPSHTTTYCVTVSDTNHCTDSACITIQVDIPCNSLAVPTAFSPNEDGYSDAFCLQGWDNCITTFNILIYDRWGEKVFESTDPAFCWDGTYSGKPMNSAVFVYYINATDVNAVQVLKKGNITLLH